MLGKTKYKKIGFLSLEIGIFHPLSKTNLGDFTRIFEDEKISISPQNILLKSSNIDPRSLYINNDAAVLMFLLEGYSFCNANFKEHSSPEVIRFFEKRKEIFESYMFNQKADISDWRLDQNLWTLEKFIFLEKSFDKKNIKRLSNALHPSLHKILLEFCGIVIVEHLPLEAIEDEDIRELVVIYKENKDVLGKLMNTEYFNQLKSFFQ